MEKFKLGVATREEKTPNQLRREGKLPATLYGNGLESESLQLDAKEFGRLPREAYSHMIEVDLSGKSANVVIRNVQRRSTTHKVLNVELYKVDMERKLTVTVPMKFVGVAPAVTVQGGQLLEVFHYAEVECLPGNIPDFIEADVSIITEIDQGLHFGELKLPEGIAILNPKEEVVARVVAKKASNEEKKEAAAPAKKAKADAPAKGAAKEAAPAKAAAKK